MFPVSIPWHIAGGSSEGIEEEHFEITRQHQPQNNRVKNLGDFQVQAEMFESIRNGSTAAGVVLYGYSFSRS